MKRGTRLFFLSLFAGVVIWLILDIVRQLEFNKEMDKNKIELYGIIEEIKYLENTATYKMEYHFEGVRYESWVHEISGLGKVVRGDTLLLDVSPVDPGNKVRFSLRNRNK